MKYLVLLLCVATFTHANVLRANTAYGYLKSSISLAEKRRDLESRYLDELSNGRVVGGVPATVGQYPWQAGLLIDIVGLSGNGVCGGSLISANRVATAAHCWWDGQNQAWRITVVLGTATLFSGGRVETSAVVSHPSWFPLLVRNDVAIIYLPNSVNNGNTIAPVALPSGPELLEDFAGDSAIASGFGLTSDDGTLSRDQFLSHVSLNVITNKACRFSFPLILQKSNICTSGIGGVGTCRGDSGGPLTVLKNKKRILIGVTSFGSALGCVLRLLRHVFY